MRSRLYDRGERGKSAESWISLLPALATYAGSFLISEESSFITGSYHLVDGGLLASF